MNKIKLTTIQFLVATFLLCGSVKKLFFFSKKIHIQLFIGKLILAAILVLSVITQINAQGIGTRTTAINITEFSFTPSTIDTTNGSQTVTMTVRVTDTERDFWSMYGDFRNAQSSFGFDFGIQDRIAGDGRDGVYRKTFTFYQYAAAGTWQVARIFVYDGTISYYRWRDFSTFELAARGFATQLQVINNNEAVPPVISDFSFTPTSINTTNNSQNVTITLRARDETSGVSSIAVEFSSPAGCYYYNDDCVTIDFSITGANRISGDDRDGVYRVVATFPQNTPLGIYGVSVFANDAVRNSTFLSSTELAAQGYPAYLRVFFGTMFDFDRDGRADLSVFRPSNGFWYLNRSQTGFTATQFGLATDKPTPADFDGDGKTDIAVYRDGTWYWLNSSNGSFNSYQFGLSSDIPVPADFTGDGRAELAVYRAGIWYIFNLTNNQLQAIQFGLASDKPVAADYDGDGKTDIAVVRQNSGTSTWYVLGTSQGFYGFQFGIDIDKPVPADYDGDGKTDFAVFRPSDGNWYVWNSTSSSLQVINWGLASDALVPADYDGDGKADFAVYRGETWYIRQTSGGINYVNFGLSSDLPTNQVR